jgi:hypothetical protein
VTHQAAPLSILCVALLACKANEVAEPITTGEPTADVAECEAYSATRNVYFGDLHTHTAQSFDAEDADVQAHPADAYAFARGEQVGLGPYDALNEPYRHATIDRPLDLVAVTDHAEDLTDDEWASHLEAATAANAPCKFTTFFGYEHSGLYTLPSGAMARLHRNVVFNSEVSPGAPIGIDDVTGPFDFLRQLRDSCADPCDVIAIPHQLNMSFGEAFSLNQLDHDVTAEEAALRAKYEPIAAIHLVKGNAECKLGFGTDDPDCTFEVLPFDNSVDLTPGSENSYSRTGLKNGLVQLEQLGVNAFKVGMIGGTDNHNALPGHAAEKGFLGAHGKHDDQYAERVSTSPITRYWNEFSLRAVNINPGGLVAVWAGENTRSEVFSALRRREVYATSGTRPAVRFFASGDFGADLCEQDPTSAIEQAYEAGVPMGGTLSAADLKGPPTFFVHATMDATPLDRIQIIKGWRDNQGNTHETVLQMAGNPMVQGTVDIETCEIGGTGHTEICAEWTDEDFDASQHAFYYLRVFENPVCRWQQHDCIAQSVTCLDGVSDPPQLDACCSPEVQPTIQERAWTSPIWYEAD